MTYALDSHPNMPCFIAALEQLPDTRDNRGKRHSLVFIIVAVILAILVGRSKTSSIHRYIKNKISWLREITNITTAQPISRAHLPRLLDKIDWYALDQLIQTYFDFYIFPKLINQEWTAIDGKVLRGTLKAGEKQAIIHAVTHDSRTEVALLPQSGTKSSEIPVVRELLKNTGLESQANTLDAHHFNPETTSQIASAQGTYLIQVKENQPILLNQCKTLEMQAQPLFSQEDHEKAHGRLTTRNAAIFSMETVELDKRWNESNINTLVVINRKTHTFKTGKDSEETSYYLSNRSIEKTDVEGADDLVKAVRKHWGVESNNWILDVTLNEDKIQIKAPNQTHIMGRLRSFRLQLLRKGGFSNFQAALEKFADSPSIMEIFLRQVNFL